MCKSKRMVIILLAALLCIGSAACATPSDTTNESASASLSETVAGGASTDASSATDATDSSIGSSESLTEPSSDTGETDAVTDTAPESESSESATETVTETSADAESETLVNDDLPPLDFEQKEIVIHGIKNHEELTGDPSGGVVSSAIHARNLMVEDRLNVRLVPSLGVGQQSMDEIRRLITSGDNSIDIISGHQWKSQMLAWDGLYVDLADEAYLNYDKPWWADSYMNEIQWDEHRYILIGDISVYMLKYMSAFYVNKPLFEDSFTPVEDLYTMVFNGNWTWDQMNTYISDVYRDANGNSIKDEDDILGLRTHAAAPTDYFAYTAGLEFSDRDADGRIYLLEDQTRNIQIAEAIRHLLYENPGCLTRPDATQNTSDVQAFAEGTTLFCARCMQSAEYFVNMRDEYAIIPYPKLDMAQPDYYTQVHDATTVFSIPITASDEEIPMLTAVLEAMASENYRRVTPAYYDVALKSRYSKDPQSAQLIDNIRANIRVDFIYANTYIFDSRGQLGTIMRKLAADPGKKYASLYKVMSTAVNRVLEDEVNARND